MVKIPTFAMITKIWPFDRPTENDIETGNHTETSSLTETKYETRCAWPSKCKPSLKAILIFPVLLFLTVVLVCKTLEKLEGSPGEKDRSFKHIPANSTKGHNFMVARRMRREVTSKEGRAQPPRGKLKELELPVDIVIINETSSNNCTTQDACILQIHAIFDNIQYNFLVGGDGVASEGRGWDKMGGDVIGSNISSIVIALIGKFANRSPPKRQVQAAKLLIQKGVILNKVARNYKLVPSANSGDKPVERLAELNIHN